MTKKKVVITVPLNSEPNYRKAMKLASQVTGVTSVSIDKGKGQLTATGEDLSAEDLSEILKEGPDPPWFLLGCLWPNHRGLGDCVKIVTVEDVKEEKKDDKKEDKKDEKLCCPAYYRPPVLSLVEVVDSSPSGCVIC